MERSRDLFTSKMFFVFLRTRKSWKRIETSKKKKKKKVGIALLVIERSALRGKNQTTNKNQKLCCCWEKEKEEIQENRTIVFFFVSFVVLFVFISENFFVSLSRRTPSCVTPLSVKKKKKKIPSVYIALAHNRWLRLFSVCCNATKLH